MAGAGALVLAGCGGRPARKLAGSRADLPALGAALELERTQIALYEEAMKVLSGREADLARQVLGYERAHAQAIAEAIRELGATPAPARAAAYRAGFPGGAPGDLIQYAMSYEDKVVAAYAAAIPKLANPRLRATFGAIMTSDAEHAVALLVSR